MPTVVMLNNITGPIQSGIVIYHQDQDITPINFSVRNIKNNIDYVPGPLYTTV